MKTSEKQLKYLLNDEFEFDYQDEKIITGKLTYTSCQKIIENINKIKTENMTHEDMIFTFLDSKLDNKYLRETVLFMLRGGKISYDIALFSIDDKNNICTVSLAGKYTKCRVMSLSKFNLILKNGRRV